MRLNLNSGLAGRLPLELTGVPLHLFHWDATDPCAPTDDGFVEWLASIRNHIGGEYCDAAIGRRVRK